jgi:hypothetical protein
MESSNSKTVYGNYAVYDTCLDSHTCKHIVENIETGKTKIMLGSNICKILSEARIYVPHFDKHISDTDKYYIWKTT